jgi:hypothetical protein
MWAKAMHGIEATGKARKGILIGFPAQFMPTSLYYTLTPGSLS